jgi:signal transduction histidine kinase
MPHDPAQTSFAHATEHHRLALANLVHDLRTPIHGVLAMLHLLPARRNDERAWNEALDIMRSCACHQLLIVDDVVDLARLGARALKLRPSRFELRPSLVQTLNMVRATAKLKGLELSLNVHANVPDEIVADERRVRQVLLNLLANAIQHTAVGSVRLNVARLGAGRESAPGSARIAFSVVDTGPGVNEESLGLLFQVFVRVCEQHDDADAGGGAGLGLALCREMLALMGSRLHCTSAAGQGCTFYFELELPDPLGR